MKYLNQKVMIQRIKSDADLIGKNCEFDVQKGVLSQIKNIEMVDSTSPVKPQKPLFNKLMMPLVGVAVLSLVIFQFVLPVQTMKQNPSNVQLVYNKSNLNSTNLTAIQKVNTNIADEKLAIKEDILYMAQVFSM